MKKFLPVCITVLFINLCLSLFQSTDSIFGFIPFMRVISTGYLRITSYEFFLVLSVLLLHVLYVHYGINIYIIKKAIRSMCHLEFKSILLSIAAVVIVTSMLIVSGGQLD